MTKLSNASNLLSIRSRIACQSDNIVNADVIIFRDFNDHGNRDFSDPPLISGIDLPVAYQNIRNFLLRFIVVDPQITDPLKVHIISPIDNGIKWYYDMLDIVSYGTLFFG